MVKPTFVLFNKENSDESQGFNKVDSCAERSPTSRGEKCSHFLENQIIYKYKIANEELLNLVAKVRF